MWNVSVNASTPINSLDFAARHLHALTGNYHSTSSLYPYSGLAQPYKPHSTLMAALGYTRKDPCRFLYHLPHTGIELLTATLCKVRHCLVVPACFCGLTRQWGLCVFTEHDKLPVQGLSGWMLLICNPVRLCTPFSVGFLVQLVRVAPSVQKCT